MKWLMIITVLMMSVIGLSKAQADIKKNIQVSVTVGDSYANALGAEITAAAKNLSELELVNSLKDFVRYFHFVSSETPANYRLQFHIANPANNSATTMQSIHDYYLFVSLKRENTPLSAELNWLFRDAASNLHGADTAESIAQSLKKHVQQQRHKIVAELLSRISFTENATLDSQGWVIQHSAKALCLFKRSKLLITSIVPEGGYEDEFTAVVKKHKDDHLTTFTKYIKTQDQGDISSLLAAPEQAKVVAVHVISYERQCEQPAITEVSPTSVSFVQGDGQ